MIVPPRNRGGFITITGGNQQWVVGALGEGDFDPVLLDVDLGGRVQEVAEDLGRARAALELAEPVGLLAPEMMTQDAEGAGGVAETPGDLLGGKLFDEIGAQRLVLALAGGGGLQEEAGLIC